MASTVIELVTGNIITFNAELIALKFAQNFWGADLAVANELMKNARIDTTFRVDIDAYKLVDSQNTLLVTPKILFVGTKTLNLWSYDEVEQLASDVLRILADVAPTLKHLAMTLHGVGFGLDESEVINAQMRGYFKAIEAGTIPPTLEKISIVEYDAGRVTRLIESFKPASIAPGLTTIGNGVYSIETRRTLRRIMPPPPRELPRDKTLAQTPIVAGILERGSDSPVAEEATYARPHAFIAMPYKPEMDDVFYYGIQRPVNGAGLLCERTDFDQFTGDVVQRVRERIEQAAVVIADLTGGNANVYLEVGYAWGRNRPTILLIADEKELMFDVKGYRCLVYKCSIRSLEQMLNAELNGLIAKGLITLTQ